MVNTRDTGGYSSTEYCFPGEASAMEQLTSRGRSSSRVERRMVSPPRSPPRGMRAGEGYSTPGTSPNKSRQFEFEGNPSTSPNRVEDFDRYFQDLFGGQRVRGGGRTSQSRSKSGSRSSRSPNPARSRASSVEGNGGNGAWRGLSSSNGEGATFHRDEPRGYSGAYDYGMKPPQQSQQTRKRGRKMAYLSETIALVIVVCVMYSSVQLYGSIRSANRHAHATATRGERPVGGGAFDEGMDRPGSAAYVRHMQKHKKNLQTPPATPSHPDPPRQRRTPSQRKEQAQPKPQPNVPPPQVQPQANQNPQTSLKKAAVDKVTPQQPAEPALTPDKAVQSQTTNAKKKVTPVEAHRHTGSTTAKTTSLPPSFGNLANVPSTAKPGDVPLLWFVPKGGASTFIDIIGGCMGMTLANEVGGQMGHEKDEALAVFEHHGSKFVNIDTMSVKGIRKAQSLHLASTGYADVIVSPYLHEISDLFSSDHKGRVFTVLRNPIHRAASIFLTLKKVDPTLARMKIEDYARSNRVENNWMTRFLANAKTGVISNDHLNQAKEVLRKKILIGLLEKKEETMERFRRYYGWSVMKKDNPDGRRQCIGQLLVASEQVFAHPGLEIEQGTLAYSLLLWQNQYDMKLYKYAQKLFEEQSKLFPAEAT